jgi:succinate dehydrogenase / fumarate reductase iron-sulfur subunit
VLYRLQATQAGDLTIQWNCKAGKMRFVQRRHQRQAEAAVHDPALRCPDLIRITPLRTYPVIRDLVTDVSVNDCWALHVPSFVPPDGLRLSEYRMARANVDRSQEFGQCIECCPRTCATRSATTRTTSPLTPGPGTSSGMPS